MNPTTHDVATARINICVRKLTMEMLLRYKQDESHASCFTLTFLVLGLPNSSDGFETLAVIISGNSSADNQPYLKNLHREYYDRQLKISQDSTQILEKDPSQVICKE